RAGSARRRQRLLDPCQCRELFTTLGGADFAIGLAIVQRVLDRDPLGLEPRRTGVLPCFSISSHGTAGQQHESSEHDSFVHDSSPVGGGGALPPCGSFFGVWHKTKGPSKVVAGDEKGAAPITVVRRST